MWEQVFADEETFTVACLAFVGTVAILVFGGGWAVINVLKVLTQARLKQQMIDRGMAPTEIEQVLRAGPEVLPPKRPCAKSQPEGKPAPTWES